MTNAGALPRLIRLGALICLFAPAGLWAQTVRLSGTVKAAPHSGVKKTSGGGGAYGKKALADAVIFDYAHPKNIVIYAEPAGSGAIPPAAGSKTLSLKENYRGVTLAPDFLTIATGSDLTLENNTKETLTFYASGRSPVGFTLALDPETKQNHRLDQIGLYSIGILEDENLSAKVFVAGPYFAMANEAGKYSINLPPGRYRVTAWQERLPAQTQEVQVLKDQPQTLDFLLTVKGLPEVQ